MLVSYELHAAAGPEYAKRWCWASQLLNSGSTVWVPACVSALVLCNFLLRRPAGLALCNGSKSGVLCSMFLQEK